jgi:hypothetical protein
MKLVRFFTEEPIAEVPDTCEVQPDYTPPRGGNWISDKISPDRVSPYMRHDPCCLFQGHHTDRTSYTAAQTTGSMNNYLVPQASNSYNVYF